MNPATADWCNADSKRPTGHCQTLYSLLQVVMTRYAHASNKLLGIQIDAAINPGGHLGMPESAEIEVIIVLIC